jgi:hypothetical protein
MTQPTEGMKRGGYYDAHSEYQQRVAASGIELLLPLLDAVTAPPAGPVLIVDYGCSSGANSITVVTESVRRLRRSDAERDVVVVHDDLPTNDFHPLFANLRDRPDSYPRLPGADVLPLASAMSFYDPVVPLRRVQLALSFSAAHWLREEPVAPVPGSFLIADATGDDRAALAGQADADSTRFLEMRASELAPGGLLFVQMIGTDTAGDAERVTAARLLHAMHDVAEAMVDTTQLDIGAFHGFVFPTYTRTVDEALAPLDWAGSPVRGAFEVALTRVDPVANPYDEAYRRSGDAEAYAERYISFVRAFSESSLRDGMFAHGSRGGAPEQTLDEFYAELRRAPSADGPRSRLVEVRGLDLDGGTHADAVNRAAAPARGSPARRSGRRGGLAGRPDQREATT